jgi:hypothetical protein
MVTVSRDLLVVVTKGKALQPASELVKGEDGMSDGDATEQECQQQTYDNEHDDDKSQAVVTSQDTPVRRDKGQTPVGVWHGLVTDETGFAVYLHAHITLLACSHLMTQGKDIGIRLGIGIAIDGLRE